MIPSRSTWSPPSRPSLRALSWIAVLALLVGSASTAHAQQTSGERALEIGARAGYDYREDVPVLGAHLRIPVDPWRRVDLVPSVELRFQSGVTERQYNLDGAFYLDQTRTLYIGGGAAFLNTFFLDDEDGGLLDTRETRTGYSVFGGLHDLPGWGDLTPQVEIRWSFVDVLRPRNISVGLNYSVPLGF